MISDWEPAPRGGERPSQEAPAPQAQTSILILAPLGNDARLTAEFLASAGLDAVVCDSAADLFSRSGVGCGALLLAEEAVDRETARILCEIIREQPSWSDIPIVIIVTGDASQERGQRLATFGSAGNVTLIERPFRAGTLISTMEAALRSRRRQFQVRDLLEENARKSGELQEQAAALRKADRRKDEFLAMLAHELRNPLASISSAADLLKETADAENQAWAADVINRQGRQLSRLVDDLLDVSRITRGKIELRRELIDAACCLESACEAVRPLIAERRHELLAKIPRGNLWLIADPARLEQIAVNLLVNAAKYTKSGGRLWLEARREANEIVFQVRDSGMGIPPGKIPEMFELFAQGERSIARSEGGLGIGLTVVRGLCELHGGTVSAHSDGFGTGTTFTVRLPASGEPDSAPLFDGPALRGAEGACQRVLIVDDNVDSAEGLARLLMRREYHVRLSHDGPSALKTAREFSPSVVLLDIGLPGMDGYELARRLRSEPCCAPALMIAVTGYGQEADRRKSLAAGFDHHIVKPLDFKELRKLLAERAALQSH